MLLNWHCRVVLTNVHDDGVHRKCDIPLIVKTLNVGHWTGWWRTCTDDYWPVPESEMHHVITLKWDENSICTIVYYHCYHRTPKYWRFWTLICYLPNNITRSVFIIFLFKVHCSTIRIASLSLSSIPKSILLVAFEPTIGQFHCDDIYSQKIPNALCRR